MTMPTTTKFWDFEEWVIGPEITTILAPDLAWRPSFLCEKVATRVCLLLMDGHLGFSEYTGGTSRLETLMTPILGLVSSALLRNPNLNDLLMTPMLPSHQSASVFLHSAYIKGKISHKLQ